MKDVAHALQKLMSKQSANPQGTWQWQPNGAKGKQNQSKAKSIAPILRKGEENVKMNISKESQTLLHAALEASSGVSQLTQSQKRQSDIDEENRPAQKYPRRHHEATVPPRTLGSDKLKAVRESLPAFEFRAQILDSICKNQVIIVEGETGCGKTTQVGQFIIEDAAEKNVPCSIVCTQPRRISAISVADRVADERGEWIGGTIGYSVRQESKAGRDTHLLFCTTGILLRRLENDAELVGTTHVVVDEVHERGVESDFLLLALRDLSRRRKDLKVVLMSATMDKDLFGKYFGGAPGIVIPGRTFPVQDFFLEDALKITKHVLDPSAEWAIGGGNGKGKGKGKGGTPASKDKDHADVRKLEDLGQVHTRYAKYGPQVMASLRGMDQDAVNYDLLASLLKKGVLEMLAGSNNWSDGTWRNDSKPSASDGRMEPKKRPNGVLVFLSGAKEIETVQLALLSLAEFQSEPARSWVLPLHGGLPSDDQKKVFNHPPVGVRKIVLATNVAETSITIDDIGFVVDTCRMKEMRFDAVRRMSTLEDTVVSRTNARQRRGRAGRVAPGVAVHLGLTRFRHDQKVDDHQPPEVQRVPLEQLVLRIHATGLHMRDQSGKAASICTKLLEPPNPVYVRKAVEELVRLGAIEVNERDGKEKLTALGKHLANLPLEARLGKLVLYGAAFGAAATDAALTVAASLTSRNPFLAPLEERDAAAKAKKGFADKMVGGPIGLSDHLAVLAAYREWDNMPHRGEERYAFCKANFLSIKTLQGMSEMKRSLLETLCEAGFVKGKIRAKDVLWTGRQHNCDGVLLALARQDPSRRGQDETEIEPCPPALVSALLCAALFPQVATATMPKVDQAKSWKAKQNAAVNGGGSKVKPKLMIKDALTGEPVRVKMHPGSVSAEETTLSSPYILYQDLTSTSALYIRDITPVPPLALALFGGPLAPDKSAGNAGILIVDGWIKLALPTHLQKPVLQIRQRLDALLASWVWQRPGDSATEHQNDLMQERGGAELLNAITEILATQAETKPLAAPLNKQQKEQAQKALKWSKKGGGSSWGGGGKKQSKAVGGWGGGGVKKQLKVVVGGWGGGGNGKKARTW